MKRWICVLLFTAVCALYTVQGETDLNYDDLKDLYYDDDDDNPHIYFDEEKLEDNKDVDLDSEFESLETEDLDRRVEDEINQYRNNDEAVDNLPVEDYQIEDNRPNAEDVYDDKIEHISDSKESVKENDEYKSHEIESAINLNDVDSSESLEEIKENVDNIYGTNQEPAQEAEQNDMESERDENILSSLEKIVDVSKTLLEDTGDVSDENVENIDEINENNANLLDSIGTSKTDDNASNLNENSDEVEDSLENLNDNVDDIEDIIRETKDLLEDIDALEDSSDMENNNADNVDESFSNERNDEDEDTVQKAYADLDKDLKTLSEIWRKLNEEEEDSAEGDVLYDEDDDKSEENVEEFEEEHEQPFKEDSILKIRDDMDYEAAIDDSFSAEETKSKKVEAQDIPSNEGIEDDNGDIESEEKLTDDVIINTSMNTTSNEDNSQLDDDDQDQAVITDDDYHDQPSIQVQAVPLTAEVNNDEAVTKTKSVSDLNSAEYDDVMRIFKAEHLDDIDPLSDAFSSRVAPIHMTIGADETLTVTSPNFPNNYPTNNVVDWIIDGEGKGIQFIIHNFTVNGILGDYLLVRPGGVDETGTDGLIFSYHLNSERRYIFNDVDRLFMRFESRMGLAMSRGFNITMRMISPLSDDEEDLPEPEPVIELPDSTVTVFLGGLNVLQFLDIKDDFRELIADMATLYINENGIDPGLNSTLEIAQVTNVSVCNMNWPNFEQCSEVRFGVPLTYEGDQEPRLNENDLRAMWYTYAGRDPFAYRLGVMNINEFAIPDDSSILMVWLVIAFGVVISMALLAFALWKYSCFEDYSRMPSFSDTDSIRNEKQQLDLYPTPHQTLPPLFENEYKFDSKYDDSYRVDVGGYPNRSYVREDLYDVDSDEEVVNKRDRYTTDV